MQKPKPESVPASGLSIETLSRVRALALEQVALKDELEAALLADDTPRVVELAWKLVGLEKQIEKTDETD